MTGAEGPGGIMVPDPPLPPVPIAAPLPPDPGPGVPGPAGPGRLLAAPGSAPGLPSLMAPVQLVTSASSPADSQVNLMCMRTSRKLEMEDAQMETRTGASPSRIASGAPN